MLLHLPSGRRVGLSATGTAVWEQILAGEAQGASAEQITTAMGAGYDADPGVIVADVLRLLGDLVTADLVEVVTPVR